LSRERAESRHTRTSQAQNRISKEGNQGLAHALYTMSAPTREGRTAPGPAGSPSKPNGSSPRPTPDFARNGYLGPVRIFTEAQRRQIAAHLKERTSPPPAEWSKGRAGTNRFWYELGTRPALLSILRSLMGDDIVLWGGTLVTRAPGQPHPWHTDIESSHPGGGFVRSGLAWRTPASNQACSL
jgi:hypothetical protein